MKVIVVDNPFVGMILEMLLGGGSDGNPLNKFVHEAGKLDHDTIQALLKGKAVVTANQVPDLKANPDFYTKPDVPKMLVLKAKSNTTPGKLYDVSVDKEQNLYCTCTGFKYRGTCTHVNRVKSLDSYRGLGLCLNCKNFSKNESHLRPRSKNGCRSTYTIVCPPMGGCQHYDGIKKFEADLPTKKEVPMTFPVEGTLLQTFQSRHFPEVQYEVKMKNNDLVCTCRGFNYHGTCKHVQYMKTRVNQGTIRI